MIGALFAKLPAWAWKAIGGAAVVLALIGAFNLWLSAHDEALINEHERALQEAITKVTEAAEDDAAGVVAESRDDVEAGNQRAREAAAGSDDPLADGLRGL